MMIRSPMTMRSTPVRISVQPVEIAFDIVQHATDPAIANLRALMLLGAEQQIAHVLRQASRIVDPAACHLIGKTEMQPA